MAASVVAPTSSRLSPWARAVLVGRPVLWGLAADGAQGVQHVREIAALLQTGISCADDGLRTVGHL